ncbi:uncharacterized protein LOC125778691, partial [Bactrocera dorsalis]|uniref:Uncharacterized protein LOC125778691 n=1 Tax=Bactrocera dorsalis TaxID=27457 RepID=A0ABM3JWS7_BACDO
MKQALPLVSSVGKPDDKDTKEVQPISKPTDKPKSPLDITKPVPHVYSSDESDEDFDKPKLADMKQALPLVSSVGKPDDKDTKDVQPISKPTDKPKSPLDITKPVPHVYSSDESDEDFDKPKPADMKQALPLVSSVGKPDDKDTKDVQPISKPEDKPKSPLDITKPVPHVYSSDESEEELDKPKLADMKQALPLVPSVGKPDDKDTKDVQPISKPTDKPKSPLDITKPVPHVYSSDESEEELDKPKLADMKQALPLVPSVGKPDDKDTKDVQPISKPEDKPKSPLDIAKSVPHVYSSDESEEELDKPKLADMKQALPLVPSVGKPDDKDTKDVQPISKPTDKPKSPLDITKPVPHVYSSDESDEDFDKPKPADMKQALPLVPSVGKPDDKDTKDVQPISKPEDKPKSPLDITKPVPHVYSSDESEEELDKPKLADMKQALPLVPSVGKPDDKDTKDVQPISKPEDKPKSPLDITKPVPHVYSSDESEEELDKPKLADMKQALPLVPSVGKPDDKDTKDVQPISKPEDKPKSPLDSAKYVPHVYSSDESEEDFGKPKPADMKQALPLVPSVGKPDDKDTKDVQSISKPEDKPKSPLDIAKPVPHVYSSDESEEDFDKPKPADMKQALPLVPSVGKPDDKDTKDVQPISKPEDKPKSPLDITKPVPHVYSSDESEEGLDKPKPADMKQALPLVPSVGKPDDKDTKDVQPISKPEDKPKSPLDIAKPVPHVYSSDESEEELDKPKLADMKQALPLVPSVGKPDDKDTKDVQPISKPEDKPKSPLDITKPVPHVYSSDESEEELDKPKLADMKQALPLVPSVGKPDDKDTKDVQPISKPEDKPKSPLDITKPVPHVYSSDESEEELDKPKPADMKQALPLVPSVGKQDDKDSKDVQPISKPTDKPKSPLDIAKPVPHVYSSDESEEDFDKPKLADMKQALPLVPSVGKPDDKDTKDVQPISKPTDKPKSPLDITKPVPHVYSSDESEEELDKPKLADMKQALPLVPSVGKPDDKDTKDVQPISKPEDKPKSPLDITKPVPHVYSSDESEEELDKPKLADMKQALPLVPSVGKPDDKDTKDVQPIPKPEDKPKSPLDIAKSVPHVYSSDESEEELDKPKLADMKQALPLVPSVGKPDDKDTKDVQPISKPTDKQKSPLDIAKSVPHVYSSDESEEELDKPKLADMKQALPLVPSVGKPDDKDTKDVQPISKPEDKPKSPLDIAKSVPHVYSSDESEEELDKPKLADMKQALPLVPSVGKPDDKDTKDVQPISKPEDKPKSPLDITKPVPHVYSSDESEEEFDKPKFADMKQALSLVSSVGKPDDKDTKDVQPISKPEDKPKSPLDITKSVPHVYSSDESEEELDKPKLADMKQALPLVPSVGKPDDKDTKDVQPISKPEDKPKSPLDITKPVPHVYSSDESEDEFDKPKLADMKQALPLVSSVGKPDDKDTKDVQSISKPEDKPKSPLDITKSVPYVYSSDESEEELDKPKLADMKQALPLVPSVGKPDDKDTKDVQPISKPEDKPKSPLDITKPVPHVYSSDESEEELDKPKLADMKQALPLVPSVGKPDDKDTKDVQPISKPEDKPKSPLDITKPVPHVYSSDESEDEFDKPKFADMKQALSLVSSVGKPDDKDTKDVQPISKPEDKPKSPLDITKPVPHVYSSDESEDEFDKPKFADMKQALPLVPSVGKPDDKDTKDVQPISKPEDKPKSPLDITKPVPHVYSSDESEDEFDKPKFADMKQALSLVSSVGKPDDKDTKDVQPISKPTDKPKPPLDITKPVSHVYSSDESEDEFDKPKFADMKQALPLVSSVGKPDDKDTKDVQPISKPEDKPKSPLDITKPVPHVHSSDESEDEFDKPKFADMKQASPLVSSVGKSDDKDTKDVKPISKPEDKLKSPLDIAKPVPHVYSSDESEDEFDKPKFADMKQASPLISSVGKPDGKDTKDVQPISKPKDKPKSPLDIAKSVPHVFSSDESEENFDKPKPADMKQASPLVSSVGKPDDKDTKDVQPIPKPEDKLKSPLDIAKPVPHVYSSDESEDEFDKPKFADIKKAVPLVPSVGKPDDKGTKDVQPISKPEDKPKSLLDITKPVPHVYSSDELEEELDKPKLADMKQALPLVPSVGKPDDKDTKDVQPISKPTDKPKSPLDITKPVPHVYSSDESEEELDKPKLADMKQALPLVPSVGKPDDKDTKDVQPISKPTDKPKSPLDITKPVPHVYSSDESEDEFDKPKLADMKQALPLVPSVGKPDDKDSKSVQPISKPTDKPKSPLDITKPVPHVYSSDESEEEFDKPKVADMKQALPLVPSVGKPDDKDTIDVHPISKPEDKPKSPLVIGKPVSHVYSSDESEKECDEPKIYEMNKKTRPLLSVVSGADVTTSEEMPFESERGQFSTSLSNSRDILDSCSSLDSLERSAAPSGGIGKERGVAYFVNLGERTELTRKNSEEFKKASVNKKLIRGVKKTSSTKVETKDTVKKSLLQNHSRYTKTEKAHPATPSGDVQNKANKTKAIANVSTRQKKHLPNKDEVSKVSTLKAAPSPLKTEVRSDRSTSLRSQTVNVGLSEDNLHSRSTTPRPRTRTDVTTMPYNATLRTFSPTSSRPKADYSHVTSVYAQTKKYEKKTTSKKTKTKTITKSSEPAGEDAQRKRLTTPTSTVMHRYMQPTLAHSLRYAHTQSTSKQADLALDTTLRSKSPGPAVLQPKGKQLTTPITTTHTDAQRRYVRNLSKEEKT